MSTSPRSLVILLAVCTFALGATAAPATEAPVSTPPAAAETAPAATPDQAAPPPDLLMPTPEAVCKTGWCSNDQQCIEWLHDPGAQCYKQPGASCGQCIS